MHTIHAAKSFSKVYIRCECLKCGVICCRRYQTRCMLSTWTLVKVLHWGLLKKSCPSASTPCLCTSCGAQWSSGLCTEVLQSVRLSVLLLAYPNCVKYDGKILIVHADALARYELKIISNGLKLRVLCAYVIFGETYLCMSMELQINRKVEIDRFQFYALKTFQIF